MAWGRGKKKKEFEATEPTKDDFEEQVEEEIEETEKEVEEIDEEKEQLKKQLKDMEKKYGDVKPKEKTVIVKELPTAPIRDYKDEDGTMVHLITVEEALQRLLELE